MQKRWKMPTGAAADDDTRRRFAPGLEKALKQAEKNVTAVRNHREKEQAVQKAKEAYGIVDEKERH